MSALGMMTAPVGYSRIGAGPAPASIDSQANRRRRDQRLTNWRGSDALKHRFASESIWLIFPCDVVERRDI